MITRGLGDFLRDAVQRGDVRAGIDATELAEAVAGITLLSLVTRPDAPDDGWLDRTATLITRGIAT